MQLETCTEKVAVWRPWAPKTPRPSQVTAVQILSLTMSHLITPSNVTARLSVVFLHALHFRHAPCARTASTLLDLAVALGLGLVLPVPGTGAAWFFSIPARAVLLLGEVPTPSQWDPAFSYRSVATPS